MYLAYDPGKTTGWARFNDDGTIHSTGQVDLSGLLTHLADMRDDGEPIKAIIYETFVLFKHKAQQQTGSKMEASQAIGMIKTLHNETGCSLIEQAPNVKYIAQKWSGVKPPSNHADSHWVDAFNHGVFFLVKLGIRKTALEEENE